MHGNTRAGREIVHAGGRRTLGARKLSQGERDHGWGQGPAETGVRASAAAVGAEQLPPCPPQWLAGSQEPANPLDRVGGTRGKGRRGTAGRGQDDQGGGEQPRIAGSGGRIVGMQFRQAAPPALRRPAAAAKNGSTSRPILAMASSR